MTFIADPIDCRVLDDWQRDFPITQRPFAAISATLGIAEVDLLNRLTRMKASGRISRVGATCAPNTISASTLAAMAATPQNLDRVVAIINAEAGVNHSYLREDKWNLWFVTTGPDRAHVDATLARISERAKLEVLNLPLVRPFNIDLGFRMGGCDGKFQQRAFPPRQADLSAMQAGDADILQILSTGMAIVANPYAEMANTLNRPEATILDRIKALQKARFISRLGVIVRHRALGWTSNAMVVWDVPSDVITGVGPRLAALPGVTLCYERRRVPGKWPYRLYNMIHAKSRSEAYKTLDAARALPELADANHKVLFSTHCFKQTGAMIAAKPGVSA
jgi:DNA-binding Lrp family transcriptional regulator